MGIVSSPTYYSFDDLNPMPGANIYRLKEIDLDNKFIYSVSKQVNFDVSKAVFKILGNPVKNHLSLSFNLPFSQRAVLRVSNAVGQILTEKEYRIERGNSTIDLNISGLSDGLYTLSIFSESINASQKFMKR